MRCFEKKNRNSMRSLLSVLAILFLSVPVFAQAKSFSHEKEKRRFIIYLPQAYHNQVDKNFPVVFNFYGGGMTMTEHMLANMWEHQ